MNIINMSKSKFDSLTPLKLPDHVINTEAEIFNFKYRGADKILKKLYCYDGIRFANKLYTIQAIESNASYIPDNFVAPEFLISIHKKIEAIVMPLIKGKNLSLILNDFSISNEEKKYYLKKMGLILEQIKNIRKYTPLTDFYIGDLHEDNIIVDDNKKNIHIVDFDSCKIMGNKSFPSRYLTPMALLNVTNGKYKKTNGDNTLSNYEVDENSDLYCYIIIILNFLYGEKINNIDVIEFYNFLNYLDDLKINVNLLNCFSKIISNEDNVNPVNYIETLTSEQIYKAKKKIYMSKNVRL